MIHLGLDASMSGATGGARYRGAEIRAWLSLADLLIVQPKVGSVLE